jgi:uncharacterized Ntn-hydrolase superfamily protein
MSGRLACAAGLGLILAALALPARATYSIAACDAQTRACGVAVQTNNLAVGASVPSVQAGVGAVVSQFETNPGHGPMALTLLSAGQDPESCLREVLARDGNFEGNGPEARQVAIVSVTGATAVHTGALVQEAAWAGARHGRGYSVQGNGLAGGEVVAAMERAFGETEGPLADRLLAALEAGDRAGGQSTGRESAALLVRTTAGWPVDVDLRVDHAPDPVGELRTLYAMQTARAQVARAAVAARAGRLSEAKALLVPAVARASGWPRLWLQAARVAAEIEESELATQYLNVAFEQNPRWVAAELGEGRYASLGQDPAFRRWISPEALAAVMESRRVAAASGERTEATTVRIALRLLEAGRPAEALATVGDPKPAGPEGPSLRLARAEAYGALGRYREAVEQVRAVLASEPDNARAARKLERLQSRSR